MNERLKQEYEKPGASLGYHDVIVGKVNDDAVSGRDRIRQKVYQLRQVADDLERLERTLPVELPFDVDRALSWLACSVRHSV